ncbi:helix-turn-helix transcriptional regulator [Listeria booriae]|uniref:helix-turn-helix domain-containing protein n=1 Tax=Listeria booriae TaxID=1552123 RepID=UPI00162608D6|nr:helix-turn-helix transcriptional regulator [Listeria booriae]MBC1553173.1 helix-turn-helix transcriptional regulator [Listeria booriae]
MEKYGDVFKIVRLDKNMTQTEIAKGSMSRSLYVKIEKENVIPSFNKFKDILERLGLTHVEFNFLLNDYRLSEKDQIIGSFSNINFFSDRTELKNLSENDCDDKFIKIITQLCKGMLLFKEGDCVEAINIGKEIWEIISVLDNYYWFDLLVIKNLIYIFDTDTLLSISDIVLKRLFEYAEFEGFFNQYIDFSTNLIFILLFNNDVSNAKYIFEKLEKSFVEYKQGFINISFLTIKSVLHIKDNDLKSFFTIVQQIRSFLNEFTNDSIVETWLFNCKMMMTEREIAFLDFIISKY